MSRSSLGHPGRPPWAVILCLAGAFTLPDLIKPLYVDDPFVLRVAEQIVAHPLDPYGFDIFWYQWPQPVSEELTPPVLPYWWAVGLALFGQRLVLWKLWLFPFVVLFATGVYRIAQRFAPGLALPLTVLTLFSPAFLPSLNVMQDIPALGLGLTGLGLALGAARDGRHGPAAVAGLVLGLALQTKYPTMTLLGVVLAHGLLWRRWRPALVTVAVALAVFFGWEWLMTLRYGKGMFFGQVDFGLFWSRRSDMLLHLVTLAGAMLPAVALLGVAALGAPRALVTGTALALFAAHALLLVAPLELRLFATLGVLALVVILAVARRLLGPFPRGRRWPTWLVRRRVEVLLVLWLAGEVAGYFLTAPFPAVRRIMGLILVCTLLVGRLASTGRRRAQLAPALVPIAALSIALALVYVIVDQREAVAQRDAARVAAQAVHAIDDRAAIWFTGHWGFQHEAEALGMKPLVPDHSPVARGDWLAIPSRVDRQGIVLAPELFEPQGILTIDSPPPLFTTWGFYGGSLPLAHAVGPRMQVALYRVRADGIPASDWSVEQLAQWAFEAGGAQAGWAAPALARELLENQDSNRRERAAQALGALGPRAAGSAPALAQALLDDPDHHVRERVAVALGALGVTDAETRAALELALEDAVPDVRAAAQRALDALREAP